MNMTKSQSHFTGKFGSFLAAMMAVSSGSAAALEVQTGLDVLQDPDTTIEGLHRLYMGYSVGEGLSLGQSIYSAAQGDAGGAFFWGYEAVKTWPISRSVDLYTSGFLGGGGGASQVSGDGLMLRYGVGLDISVSKNWGIIGGLSHIAIDGGDEAATAMSIGLSYSAGASGYSWEGLPIYSVAARSSLVSYGGGVTRGGAPQQDLVLVGAEFSFKGGPTGEYFFAADGAAKGGEGYMQVMSGLRGRASLGRVSGFYEGSLGFGGGGEVDTSGGLLAQVGIGVGVNVGDRLVLEAMLSEQIAPQSGNRGSVATLKLSRVFGRDRADVDAASPEQNWLFSTGVSQQLPNSNFRNTPSRTGRPVMQESSVDMFLGERFYLTGNAQTVLGGNAAGYAIGLVGLGYRSRLGASTTWSIEGHIGAAGGGSVAADGGAIYSIRGEVDYWINPSMAISLGAGRIATLSGEGMSPNFINLGLKIPFSTH
jgi:hypothetical protein